MSAKAREAARRIAMNAAGARGAGDMSANSMLSKLGQISAAAAAPRAGEEVRDIAISSITPDPSQPRKTFVADELEALRESMKATRLHQPIVVSEHAPGQYRIVLGERRWRAARDLGWSAIQAIVRVMEPLDAALAQLVENFEGARAGVSPFEEAARISELMEQFSLSQAAIAKGLGIKEALVSKRLALVAVKPQIRLALQDGRITDHEAALPLSRLWERAPKQAEQLLNDMVEGRADRLAVQMALAQIDQHDDSMGTTRKRRGRRATQVPDWLAGAVTPRVKVRYTPAKNEGGHSKIILAGSAQELESLFRRLEIPTAEQG